MRQIELLYFEELSPFHEQVFAFPALGRLSMRQLGIIGISIITSWSVYQATENPLSMILLVAGGYLGFRRFNVKPFESQFVSIIRFFLAYRPKAGKDAASRRGQAEPSNKLAVTDAFDPNVKELGREVRIREIPVDPLKPIRLQIKLEAADKTPISNTKTRVEFDGDVVSTLSTNNNGEIEVLVIPRTLGHKRLTVFAEGHDDPVFEEILSIVGC